MFMMETPKRLHLDIDSILVHFELPRLRLGKAITEWVESTGSLTEAENQRLDKLYQKALKSADGWNEEELKMKFISLIFDLADIEESDKIVSFYERPMTAVLKNVKISVICDCLLASAAGIATPRTPYFFLQEFKKQKGDSNDPEAQMLAAMLVAQHRNADDKPVYGAWVVGSIWNFTLLSGAEYFISPKFDASDRADLTRIVLIIRRLKENILNR
jgi:hypothetical protein